MDVGKEEPPPSPPRSCIICTSSTQQELVKPCRSCTSDYCKECLVDMFAVATTDGTRMPPRCCTFLQIHTAIGSLSEHQASEYRNKFEEWITLNKIYCPSPTCSAYISERHITTSDASSKVSLQSVLLEVLEAVSESPAARFFRGELPITELPGYAAVVTRPMNLALVRTSLQDARYSTMNQLTTDMMLIVTNAKHYHGSEHPVAKTADQLFDRYLAELSAATDKLLLLAAGTKAGDHFVCPECHIAICAKCKRIEHSSLPCDTTTQDHEMAMLEQFRYKRCPLCKHAVKKMYGCSHIQCVCGAHWCYYCQQSINECDGACAEREDSEDDEEDFDDEDDIHTSDMKDGDANLEGDSADPAKLGNEKASHPLSTATPTTQQPDGSAVNLDAGGARRWAEADFDFGDEPEDEGYIQIWSCSHLFETYQAANDEHNRGDLGKMECNKCFTSVRPLYPRKTKAAPKRSLLQKAFSKRTQVATVLRHEDQGPETTNAAMECRWCRLVVCQGCCDNLKAIKGS